jgi:sugar phosphate isomerase/epimerase
MQRLLVLQSLWAMWKLRNGADDPPLEETLPRIKAAGFDGISGLLVDYADAKRLTAMAKDFGLVVEGLAYPHDVESLKPAIEWGAEFGIQHLNVQPDLRPRKVADAVRVFEGWAKLAEQVDYPVLVETHRNRATNDLHFTLDIIDAFPALKLTADLSHFVTAREVQLPVTDEVEAQVRTILDHAWHIHGRVADSGHIQVPLSYPQHQPWVKQFEAWWSYAFRSWRKRAAPDATMTFLCELGPQPYAISGADGRDLTDRWAESLVLRDTARRLWTESA